MERLTSLNLVSRVLRDLEHHLGVSDRTLAEFLVALGTENPTQPLFSAALASAGAEFPEALVSSVFKTISALRAAPAHAGGAGGGASGGARLSGVGPFSALAIPDAAPPNGHFVSAYDGTSTNDTGLRALAVSDARAGAAGESAGAGSGAGIKRPRETDMLPPPPPPASRWGAPPVSIGASRWDGGSAPPPPPQQPPQASGAPTLYGIYTGKVSNIKDFGAFVELDGFTTRVEGLVHITAIRAGARVTHPSDVVARGASVRVKVISLLPKLSLSMKDVDQATGADLMPSRQAPALEERAALASGASAGGRSLVGLSGVRVADEWERAEGVGGARGSGGGASRLTGANAVGGGGGRMTKRMSSPERFEAKQLAMSGVLSIDELPDFEEGRGLRGGVGSGDIDEAEFDIEITEEEAPFLAGQLRAARELSPVKLVANPDGSLSRAAMTQSALSKERRELKTLQQGQLLDAIPKDLERAWEDPMAAPGERHLAEELRGIGMSLAESSAPPAWKVKAAAGDISFGKRSSLPLKEQREALPIFALRDTFINAMRDHQVLILIGETGSGKTTQMGQYLADAGFAARGMIGVTQPRRVAAITVAKRVAEEKGVRLGEEVGYSVRFDDMSSPSTVIKFMTDGMLMREYLMDNRLSRYSVIIIDEAHERTINTDILFGLLKQLLRARPEFKLIVTSATLAADTFAEYFLRCPILRVPGRTFPVEIRYALEPEADYMDATLITIMQIHLREPRGDILVFLTGAEEIDLACETLDSRMRALGPGVPELIVLPIYAQIQDEVQSRVFEPTPLHARKCIVATNLAEASLTIDGVYYVIDPGFSKQNVFNPKTGMDSLVVMPISQQSAQQRSGRAGRTNPGVCYRLYTEAAFKHEMLPSTVPEIKRANLSNVVLQMKAMGINDLLHFDFMEPPAPAVLIAALNSLYMLGALDEEGLLTRLGRKMAEFPLDPQMSKTLLAGVDLGCADEVLTVVSMLTVEGVFYRPKDRQAQADARKARFTQVEGDHITLLAVYNAWAASKFSNAWCHENFIQARAMKKAQEVRKQLVGLLDRFRLDIVSCGKNYKRVCQAIASGYFCNVAKKDAVEGYKTLIDGQPVSIHPSSSLFQQSPDMVLYEKVVMTSKEYMRNVMVVDPKWLVDVAPRFFKAADTSKLSKTKRRVKIEPLFDKFNPPDQWRLSKRQFA